MLQSPDLQTVFSDPGRLTAFVRACCLDAGMERSIKGAPARLDADRILLSFAATPHVASILSSLLDDAGLPERVDRQLRQSIYSADFVHLGHDHGEGRPAAKLYCEAEGGRASDEPVFTAWKWPVEDPAKVSVDEYRRANCGTVQDVQTLVAEVLGAGLDVLASEIVTLAGRCGDESGPPAILDVRRQGGTRTSLDMTCYGSDLRVRDASGLVAIADDLFGMDGSFVDAVTVHAEVDLGHIAAGYGEDGRPFVTVYFGSGPLS
jgi:hypothetical protein